MSYQLPDLLSLSTSLASANDDGDLHINPSYNEVSSTALPWLLTHLPRSNSLHTANESHLQKTTHEFLNEYNPGLLASTYFPFSPVLSAASGPSILQVATEWLGISALAAEETLRPQRITDFELGLSSSETIPTGKGLDDLLAQSPWKCITPHLSDFFIADGALHGYVRELLRAHLHPPPRPNPSSHLPTTVTEYLEWRISLSGLRVLSELFLSLDKYSKYQRVLTLALEIITCVTELFAYNIHQAWHSQSNNSPNHHLNMLSYLLTADPALTLQGAVNFIGGMIRDRTTQLKDELETHNHQPQSSSTKSGGVLASILSPFFAGAQDAASSDSHDDTEIRRTLVNWVTGTIHWAYEVEYFFPQLEDEHPGSGSGSGSGSRRKRGGEIRDYGWIFLIKHQGRNVNE